MIRPYQGADVPTDPHTPPLNWSDLAAQALAGGMPGQGKSPAVRHLVLHRVHAEQQAGGGHD